MKITKFQLKQGEIQLLKEVNLKKIQYYTNINKNTNKTYKKQKNNIKSTKILIK